MYLYQILRNLRTSNNLSRKELAELTQTKESTISSYESENKTHRRTPSEEYLKAISAIFGIQFDKLNEKFLLFRESESFEDFLRQSKLHPVSHALNKFIFFGNFKLSEMKLLAHDVNAEDFSIILNLPNNLNENSKAAHVYVGEVPVIVTYASWIHKVLASIIISINGIKTSDFQLSLDSYISYVDNSILAELVKLDSTGYPLTKEGVELYKLDSFKKNSSHPNRTHYLEDLLEKYNNNEVVELLELWEWATHPLRQGILELLRDVKERDSKVIKDLTKTFLSSDSETP